MDFSSVKKIVIPEGEVKQIECNGVVLWKGGYTNVLPLATDTDRKTIYQGKGYITGYRLSSSSGSLSANANMRTSGFISAKEGDVIRIKGISPRRGTPSYVITYNSNNTKIQYRSIPQHDDGTDYYDIVYDWYSYKNGIITIKLLSSYFGTGFNAFRFCAGVIDENTIVTINEEIE